MHILKEAACIFTAVIAGIFSRKQMDRFHLFIFFQLLTGFFFYILSYLVIVYQRANNLGLNNHWVFNLNTLVETSLLSIAALSFLKTKADKNLVTFLYVLFVIAVLSLLSVNGWLVFSVPAYAAESFVVVAMYSLILYRYFGQNRPSKTGNSEIWICTGLLIYFAGNLPYFSLFNFFNAHYPALSKSFHAIITEILANVRYLLVAVGFWLVKKNALNHRNLYHE